MSFERLRRVSETRVQVPGDQVVLAEVAANSEMDAGSARLVDADAPDRYNFASSAMDEFSNRVMVDEAARPRRDEPGLFPIGIGELVFLGALLQRLLGHPEKRQHVDRAVDRGEGDVDGRPPTVASTSPTSTRTAELTSRSSARGKMQTTADRSILSDRSMPRKHSRPLSDARKISGDVVVVHAVHCSVVIQTVADCPLTEVQAADHVPLRGHVDRGCAPVCGDSPRAGTRRGSGSLSANAGPRPSSRRSADSRRTAGSSPSPGRPRRHPGDTRTRRGFVGEPAFQDVSRVRVRTSRQTVSRSNPALAIATISAFKRP